MWQPLVGIGCEGLLAVLKNIWTLNGDELVLSCVCLYLALNLCPCTKVTWTAGPADSSSGSKSSRRGITRQARVIEAAHAVAVDFQAGALVRPETKFSQSAGIMIGGRHEYRPT